MLSLRTPEERVAKEHPLRAVKALADEALVEPSQVFSEGVARRPRFNLGASTWGAWSLTQSLASESGAASCGETIGQEVQPTKPG